MGIPFYKTFFRVTVPMCLPAILEMVMYYFVNSMVTVSAVVFLYAADFKLATVSIVNMDDAGNVAPAICNECAYCCYKYCSKSCI